MRPSENNSLEGIEKGLRHTACIGNFTQDPAPHPTRAQVRSHAQKWEKKMEKHSEFLAKHGSRPHQYHGGGGRRGDEYGDGEDTAVEANCDYAKYHARLLQRRELPRVSLPEGRRAASSEEWRTGGPAAAQWPPPPIQRLAPHEEASSSAAAASSSSSSPSWFREGAPAAVRRA